MACRNLEIYRTGELDSKLCDDLGGWDGGGVGERSKRTMHGKSL